MIDVRSILMQCTLRQKAGNSFKLNIPTSWIRDMGLSEYDRKVKLIYDNVNKIIIIKK